MQASDRALARRYARALFEAGAEKKEEGKIQVDFQQAWPLIVDLSPVLRDPRITSAEKSKVLDRAMGDKLTETTRRFLELLIAKKRFNLLPMVVNDLGQLINEKHNIVKAQVRTAKPLTADQQQKLKEKLKAFAGKNIDLEVKEDPEIIGGVIVRLGDWVLDSSLRGQLKKMKESLTNGN